MGRGRVLWPIKFNTTCSICKCFTMWNLVKFLPDYMQCQQGVKNCWRAAVWKGVHDPIMLNMFFLFLGSIRKRGADKSLARPTSRCRRTETIVSLERETCSCAELQVFSCYSDWKKACQATRAISITSRRGLSSGFFFSARQGAERNSRHSDRNIKRTCTKVGHRLKLGGPV